LIGEPGPERVAEGGGTIVLDEEMGEPREGVREEKSGEKEPGAAKENGGDDDGPSEKSSDRVKCAGERTAVRENVDGPKIGEGGGGGHGGDSNASGDEGKPQNS